MAQLIQAYNGAANTTVIKVKPSIEAQGIALLEGFIDFESNSIERVVFAHDDKQISSETDSIMLNGNELEIEFGDLGLEEGENDRGLLLMYIQGIPDPIVIAGAGLHDSVILSVSTIPTIS